MTYTKETNYNLQEVTSFSLGYSKRPFIAFVKSKSEEEQITNQEKLNANGQQVASFYKDLIQSDIKTVAKTDYQQKSQQYQICEVCQIPIYDPERHNMNAAHLSALSNPQAPLSALSIDSQSTGYRYLVKYGWSPFTPTGLGVPGREGSRVPINTKIKNDKYGIGVLFENTKQEQQKHTISNTPQAKQYDESQKRKRKMIHQDLYGDPKVSEYFGI